MYIESTAGHLLFLLAALFQCKMMRDKSIVPFLCKDVFQSSAKANINTNRYRQIKYILASDYCFQTDLTKCYFLKFATNLVGLIS